MSHTGTVRTYGVQKGFGFIGSDQIVGDVYFQQRDLPAEFQGQDINLQGVTVFFEVEYKPDGKPQGRQVQVEALLEDVLKNGGGGGGGGAGLAPAAPAAAGAGEVLGEVRSYNAAKGFGFVASPDVQGDLYFQTRDLSPQLQGQPLSNGMQLKFTPFQTPDGKMQARNIRPAAGINRAGAQAGARPAMRPQPAAPMFGGHMPAPPMAPLMMMQQMQQQRGGVMMNPMMMGGGGLPQEGANLTGTVKTFDAAKDFGFLSVPQLPQDVYFKSEGHLIEVGASVTFTLKWMKDGKAQARGIGPGLAGGEVLVGTVRSYSDKNGYGFLSISEGSQDVYFQKKDLPVDLQGVDGKEMKNAQLRFTVKVKPDGKPQAEAPIELVAFGGADPQQEAHMGSIQPLAMTGVKRAPAGNPIIPMQKVARTAAAAAVPQGGEGARHVGTVKTFNVTKGFGFIEAPEVGSDVFFKNTMLPPHLQQSADLIGQSVSFDLRITADGKAQGAHLQIV